MSNEAFEKRLTTKPKLSDTIYYSHAVMKAAFQAGQVAERDAIVQYIIDQGTVEVKGNEDIYYITGDDIEAIKARG